MIRSVLLLVVTFAVATAALTGGVAVAPEGKVVASGFSIRESPVARLLGGPSTRALDGLISCGSAGNIRDVRFEGCTRTPCDTLVGNSYRIEVDVVPSRSYDVLSLAIDLFTNSGVEPILNGEIPDSAVEAGRQYTFGFTIRTTGAFTGAANILFRLFGDETLDELCFIVGVHVATPFVN